MIVFINTSERNNKNGVDFKRNYFCYFYQYSRNDVNNYRFFGGIKALYITLNYSFYITEDRHLGYESIMYITI